MKLKLVVTVSSNLFSRIEKFRAREKRSTFVEYLLELGLREHLKNVKNNEAKT